MPSISRQNDSTDHPQRVLRLRDGRLVHLRPIRASDAPLERDFLSHLPAEDRAYRFLGLVQAPSSRVARELTRPDADEIVLAAFAESEGQHCEVGVARYRPRDDGESCDCAVAVDPEWQQLGIGRFLMQNLIDAARSQGVHRMYSVDAARCAGAHKLAEKLGFHSCPDPEDPISTTFELDLYGSGRRGRR